ncbi:MAG TPA: heavy-metal-associated domain-containing protein [Burkholderiales bacterium]|nr:heavy-metal-associated domain-containing protein [Burkholderiales bacterium]
MIEMNVKDMTCNHCVGVVTRTVKQVDPKAEVQVDLPSKRVRVETGHSFGELAKALNEAGYPATQAGG